MLTIYQTSALIDWNIDDPKENPQVPVDAIETSKVQPIVKLLVTKQIQQNGPRSIRNDRHWNGWPQMTRRLKFIGLFSPAFNAARVDDTVFV